MGDDSDSLYHQFMMIARYGPKGAASRTSLDDYVDLGEKWEEMHD